MEQWDEYWRATVEQPNGPLGAILLEMENTEPTLLEDPKSYTRGKKMIKKLKRRFAGTHQWEGYFTHPVNVLPKEDIKSTGQCCDTLYVAIGTKDKVNVRILEAVEHLKLCPETKHVVFHAAKWNAAEWLNHKDSFKGVFCVLRILGHKPFIKL